MYPQTEVLWGRLSQINDIIVFWGPPKWLLHFSNSFYVHVQLFTWCSITQLYCQLNYSLFQLFTTFHKTTSNRIFLLTEDSPTLKHLKTTLRTAIDPVFHQLYSFQIPRIALQIFWWPISKSMANRKILPITKSPSFQHSNNPPLISVAPFFSPLDAVQDHIHDLTGADRTAHQNDISVTKLKIQLHQKNRLVSEIPDLK